MVSSSVPVTPESVRPFPKVLSGKFDTKRGRKKGTTRILTKTREKEVNKTEIIQKKLSKMPKYIYTSIIPFFARNF